MKLIYITKQYVLINADKIASIDYTNGYTSFNLVNDTGYSVDGDFISDVLEMMKKEGPCVIYI